MKVTFFGVRGSIPSPGINTVRFGGNTPCIYINGDAGAHVILDAGTGIRLLGNQLKNDDKPIYLLLSHRHWDHIQGFPFFKPVYDHRTQIHVVCGLSGTKDNLSLLMQLSDPFFPVSAEALPSFITLMHPDKATDAIPGINLSSVPINHPGGGTAYFFEADGSRLAYVTDNELFPPTPPTTPYERWVEYCSGLDCLIHDASYTDEELESRKGWGHSSISQALQLGIDAGVRRLVLFHHEPDRTDDEIEATVAACQHQAGSRLEVIAAREGETLAI